MAQTMETFICVDFGMTGSGSWAKFPVVADFKRLAEDAVFSSFITTDKIRIHTHLTEGEASALCLLNCSTVANKSREFAAGDIVVSCDIGGATTDIAISIVAGAGKLDPCPQLRVHPVGVMSIDMNFWELPRQTLRKAGLQQNADDLAKEMSCGKWFTSTRSSFARTSGVERIEIVLPPGHTVGDWPSAETEIHDHRMSIIRDNSISIHRDVFESLFEDCVQQIEAGVDEVMAKLSKVDRVPTVLGFCGGGSKTVYIMDRLRRRYGETTPIIDHRQLAVSAELATITGNSLASNMTQLQKFAQNTRFGIKSKEESTLKVDSTLRVAEENKKNPSFYMTPVWVATFASSSRRGKVARYTLFPVSANAADAGSGNKDRILKQWVVEVDLTKKKWKGGSRTKEHYMLCKIVGLGKIDVEIQSHKGRVNYTEQVDPESDCH
ncbi:hypothetical protein IFR05_007319 [Cadophora sp. M221]|nr:hypothetical protein IFR05_007319 [Cadophora sp. M221]